MISTESAVYLTFHIAVDRL